MSREVGMVNTVVICATYILPRDNPKLMSLAYVYSSVVNDVLAIIPSVHGDHCSRLFAWFVGVRSITSV